MKIATGRILYFSTYMYFVLSLIRFIFINIVNAASPKKPVPDVVRKDPVMIEIKGNDGIEKVIEVMTSNKSNARVQEQACQRLCSLANSDGIHSYRR